MRDPERPELQQALVAREHEADRLTHDLIRLLLEGDSTGLPFMPADGHVLASALDDIVDHAEQAGSLIQIYRINAPMEPAVAVADVLAAATQRVSSALTALCRGADLGSHLVEIHRLENEADRLSRGGVASLFIDGIDPMVVIRWKDVYEALESSVDACERVAHLLEGVVLKQRTRPLGPLRLIR